MVLVLSASCNRKMEFQHETFATFDAVSFGVDETVGQVKVPVSIYNPTGSEIQITLKAVDGKAVEGVDYEVVSPTSGILTFSGDQTTQEITVNITDYSGEFTGAKDFKLVIESATAGVSVGNYNTASFNIKDLDHPLSKYIGTWEGTMVGMFQSGSWPTSFTIAADEDDQTFTKLIIDDGINPYFIAAGIKGVTFQAEVSGDQVVVYAEQPMGYSDVVVLGFDAADPNEASAYDHLRFQYNEDGTLTQLNAYGAYTPGAGGFYEIYMGGPVFTRK